MPGSLDGLLIRKNLSTGHTVLKGTDGPVAIRIRNKAGNAVTSVTTITGTNIILIDSAGTTTSTFATDTTVGAVVARINASSTWEAKALDSLLADASATQFVNGAITANADSNGVIGYDVLIDTSAALSITVCLSPFRAWDAPVGHRVNLKKLKYVVDMGTAAADSAQLYRRLNGVETKIWGILSVDTTATTPVDYTAGSFDFYGRNDEEFIFRVKDAATLADATANFVEITGQLE